MRSASVCTSLIEDTTMPMILLGNHAHGKFQHCEVYSIEESPKEAESAGEKDHGHHHAYRPHSSSSSTLIPPPSPTSNRRAKPLAALRKTWSTALTNLIATLHRQQHPPASPNSDSNPKTALSPSSPLSSNPPRPKSRGGKLTKPKPPLSSPTTPRNGSLSLSHPRTSSLSQPPRTPVRRVSLSTATTSTATTKVSTRATTTPRCSSLTSTATTVLPQSQRQSQEQGQGQQGQGEGEGLSPPPTPRRLRVQTSPRVSIYRGRSMVFEEVCV